MLRKSVLIIGGSSGIGKATAKEFAENGYDIFVTYHKGLTNDLKSFCEDKGVNFVAYQLDVRKKQDFSAIFEKVQKAADYLDCVVYCSGLSLDEKLLMDESYEDIDEIIDVNLKGGIYCAKEAMSAFSHLNHGSIIFVSSIYGVYGGACESAYSASKGGLIALTKALAEECGNFNVRVNCVAPGCIETNMTARFSESEKADIAESTPLKRIGQPEDVAKTIKFLASDDASFITGEVVTVSGGAVKF